MQITITSADLALLMPLVIPVVDTATNRFVFDGETLTYPDAVASQVASIMADPTWRTKSQKQALAAYAASARYTKETAGITVGGVAVATDRQTQAMLAGAYNMATADATFTTQWKGESGAFVSLDAPTIIAIAKAVGAHVAACFATEAAQVAAINAGTVTTTGAIDGAFA